MQLVVGLNIFWQLLCVRSEFKLMLTLTMMEMINCCRNWPSSIYNQSNLPTDINIIRKRSHRHQITITIYGEAASF
jgi:hypothetical protein